MSKTPGVAILGAFALFVVGCNADESSTPTENLGPPTATEPTETITNEPRPLLVAQVVDGDTIYLDSGDRIRLVQIDAPEGKGECYGKKAGRVLRQLLPVGTQVSVARDPRLTNADRFGRLLRYVVRGSAKGPVRGMAGQSVNLGLIERGAASAWFSGGARGPGCEPGYSPCLPITGDLDCPDVEAMGLAPITVTGSDRYRLDGDGDGTGCE